MSVESKKAVIISLNERNRVIEFSGNELFQAVKEGFSDFIDQKTEVVLQLKDDN